MEEEKRVLAQSDEVQRLISRMAHEILEKNGAVSDLTLIGIRSRGALLVKRIAKKIDSIKGETPPIGVIDVSPYRDDEKRTEEPPPGRLIEPALSLADRTVVLIDDVIFTGRTVRAALDLIGSREKPKKIIVAVLVDRGARQLPIKADIVGKNIDVLASERINVLLEETDGINQIIVTRLAHKQRQL